MTNFEKYKNKILEIATESNGNPAKKDGVIISCDSLRCRECDFVADDSGGCRKNGTLGSTKMTENRSLHAALASMQAKTRKNTPVQGAAGDIQICSNRNRRKHVRVSF